MTDQNRASWCFTINNYTSKDIATVRKALRTGRIGRVKEACVGLEVAPTTGTRHIQGYVRFSEPLPKGYIDRIIPRGYNRPCRNPRAAKDYCRKGGRLIVDVDTDRSVGVIKDPFWS